MARTIFNNGITVDVGALGSSPILDDSLVWIANDYDITIAYDLYADLQSKLRIKQAPTISVTQKFGYRIAGRELAKLGDGANKKNRKIEYGNKKGYLTKDFGEKIEVTYKMYQYLKNQNTLTGANDDVKSEYIQLTQDSKDLNLGRMETMNIESVALKTMGWSSSANFGPGSPTPNLQPLFSASHPILSTGGTFSNVLSTIDKVISKDRLQTAIDQLKTWVKLQNGKFVKQGPAPVYHLELGTTLAVTGRQILNTYGKSTGMYSGAYGAASNSSNSNQINQFYFEGNLVEIVEIPNLGDIVDSSYGYGSVLGAQTYWFVTNPFALDRLGALKRFEDYAPRMKNYEKFDNDTFVVDIRANVGVDHYYAECAMVGSRGTVA